MDPIMGGVDTEIAAKEEAYYNRIGFHRNNVYKAFVNLIKNPASNIMIYDKPVYLIADKVEPDVRNHDMSKYSDEEFYAYRLKWNPTTMEQIRLANDEEFSKKMYSDFELAWKHHEMNNDHHPQFWCLDKDGEPTEPRDMSVVAMLHMICDWEGMSMEVGGSTKDWWVANRDDKSKYMTENTIKFVDMIISQLPDIKYPVKNGG